MAQNVAIELKKITKSFGGNIANKDVDLKVYRGEILSILVRTAVVKLRL